MNEELRMLLAKVSTTCSFFDFPFADVNETNSDGDNALHCVVGWGDVRGVELLLEAGINVNTATLVTPHCTLRAWEGTKRLFAF